jgi:hypothetical protein
MLQTKLDNVKIGFEFGHEIEVVEDGMKWSAVVTPVVDPRISEKNRISWGINH